MIEINETKLFDLKEISENLKVNVVTLRRYIHRGKLRAQKIGKNYYVSEKNLNDFLNATKQKSLTGETEK